MPQFYNWGFFVGRIDGLPNISAGRRNNWCACRYERADVFGILIEYRSIYWELCTKEFCVAFNVSCRKIPQGVLHYAYCFALLDFN
ncbi:MAG: hypothetical protein ACI865_002653, partial [Flavobacteriaceae bacterium]